MTLNFYCYKALNFENTIVKDYVYIEKKEDLYPLLKEKKLQLIKAYKPSSINISPFKGTIFKTLQEWCYFLSHLLVNNIPLLEALKMLALSTRSLYFKQVLYRLIYDLESGLPLSESLSKHPLIFNFIFIQTIKTSEKTGELFKAFQNLYIYFNWVISIRKKMTDSLRYPLFLMCFLITIASVLQIYFVPELLTFLNQSHVESPSLNAWLWMQDHLLTLFLIPFSFGIALWGIAKILNYLNLLNPHCLNKKKSHFIFLKARLNSFSFVYFIKPALSPIQL